MSSLDVSNMTTKQIRADLEDIISKYNSINTIQFKHKSIEMEDTLIPRDIYNQIQHAIDLVERMSYKEILDEFKTLEVQDTLIKPLIEIIESNPLEETKKSKTKRSKKSEHSEIAFNYDQVAFLQGKVKILYNELIRSLITRNITITK
jgi:hypothetical protein